MEEKLFNKKFDKIFVANIENILIQSIISSLKFNELITFDDGTANILKNSMLYQNNESWKLKFIKFIFMIDHDINTLKDISSLHYTIYDMDNIIKNTKRISIFNFNNSGGNVLSGVLKICLGQRLYNDDAKNVDLFKKIIDKYNIDYHIVSKKTELNFENLSEEVVKEHKIIIQCTPVGTFPNVEQSLPFPFGGISSQHVVIDLIYNPPQTQFLRKAHKMGAETMNGLLMLEQQAEKAWEIWNFK